jgi:hypothetical protein
MTAEPSAPKRNRSRREKIMPETSDETTRAELRITAEEARRIADLLRYAISLNTTTGLVSPTQRRLATSTYKAAELAALVLEGKTFDEAVEESSKTWTGSLEEDHRRALELLERQRDTLKKAMANRLSPEQIAEYLEVSQDQFLDLVRPNFARKGVTEEPEG